MDLRGYQLPVLDSRYLLNLLGQSDLEPLLRFAFDLRSQINTFKSICLSVGLVRFLFNL